MKILYHHRTLGDGAEGIHIREMVRAFRQIGHDVRVIGPAGEGSPETARRSRALERIKRLVPQALFELLEILYSVYCFAKTSWAIRTFRPDFIYDRYITFNAGAVLAGKLFRVPVFLEVNAPLALERSVERDERLVFRKLAARMERWIAGNATRTIVVSTPLKQYLESIGVPREKCIVMPNGVDAERFSPKPPDDALRARLGIEADYFVIGFTGVLRSWHGLDLLVEAVGRMAAQELPVFLLIVGDGPYRAELEHLLAQHGLAERARITGRISHDAVANHVSLFDVAVSPRATFYASPMKVIEYMALGKPVVVPATPNFSDIVTDRADGVAFQEGSAADMEIKLAALYRDPGLCCALGRCARESVETRFNWRGNATRVCGLYYAAC
jgi:glycosyltransferase involved in cell wall biosynthesis